MPNISKIILPNGTQCNLNDSRVNSSTSAGVVASGAGQSHKIWMTDGNGNPEHGDLLFQWVLLQMLLF